MDILTHTLSGTAVACLAAAYLPESKYREKHKEKIFLLLGGSLAAAFPDIDALSLWSGFDATFGKWLSLKHSGKEIYFGKFWYSHHAFFHSLMAAFFFALFITSLLFLPNHFKKNTLHSVAHPKSRTDITKQKTVSLNYFYRVFGIVLFLAYSLHLLEDMPTPASVWGGVRFFWPLKNYIGGWGNIWWWNNYDIFLIITCAILLDFLVLFVFARQLARYRKILLTGIFLAATGLALLQISRRPISFAYQGFSVRYQEKEAQSKKIQKAILDRKFYQHMEAFDKKLPFNF